MRNVQNSNFKFPSRLCHRANTLPKRCWVLIEAQHLGVRLVREPGAFAPFFVEKDARFCGSVRRKYSMCDVNTIGSPLSNETDTGEEPCTSTPAPKRSQTRLEKRQSLRNHFLDGTARTSIGRISDNLSLSLSDSSSLDTVSLNEFQTSRVSLCPICPSVLIRLQNAFEASGRHGKELFRRKSCHKNPKKTGVKQHRNLKEQNAWIKSNLFDSQGNYSYCRACILAFFDISKQRLSNLRSIKRKEVHSPVSHMTKGDVCDKKLVDCVIMPQEETRSFKQWWDSVANDDTVDIKVPHGEHGLSRRASNNAKTSIADVSIITYTESYTHSCNHASV